MKGDHVSIDVDGLGGLERTGDALDRLPRRFIENLTADLAASIRSKIRSRSGRLAADWRGRAETDRLGFVETTGTRYGKASVRGAYLRPRRGRVLAFRDESGRMVFRRWIRLAPGNYIGRPGDRRNSYVSRGLRDRRAIAQRALKRTLAEGDA